MLPTKFTYPFCYTPHPLILQAAEGLMAMIESDKELQDSLAEGKMLGVMLVQYPDGRLGELYAFSGNIGGKNMVKGFVPPILNLLEPEGYFKQEEKAISAINEKIHNIGDSDPELTQKLKEERKRRSMLLQDWIFSNYIVCNALGERKSIAEIFEMQGLTPPGGTGDCAAPKLLNYANSQGLKPLAMGEFWYGRAPEKEIRRHGQFYPSCMGKCGPLLPWMMRGLEIEDNPLEKNASAPDIIYCDDDIIVANKAPGTLSVPGRTPVKSLQEQLEERLGSKVYSCHRLDMDTSGLIVYARNMESKICIERQFAAHEVHKKYIARLCASDTPLPSVGRIELPISADYYDRPRQIVDYEHGKSAVTEFKALKADKDLAILNPDGTADICFVPHTGRTHQLRVHSAHNKGLGRPILGDHLYGGIKLDELLDKPSRLHLHASDLEFHHPVSNDILSFHSMPDWLNQNG